MRKLVFIFLCVLVSATLSLLLNCSDDEVTPVEPKPGPAVICPLAVGNVWNYADTIWMGSPQSFGSNIQIVGDTTMTVGHVDYHAFFWVEVDSVNNEPTTLLVANESDGLWELGIWCASESLYFLNQAAKYPAVVGDEWIKGYFACASGIIQGFPPDTTVCISVDSLVPTPAGNFTCHVYHENYNLMIFGDYDIYKYYAPNVGLVGLDAVASSIQWKKRLSSYTLR